MIILDASVTVEVLLASEVGRGVVARWQVEDEAHAPQLMGVETLHVIRRWLSKGKIGADQAGQMVRFLPQLPIRRHDHELLLPRMWELRDNLSAYDATYVALAEVLGAPLLTRDARLAASPGHRAAIEFVDPGATTHLQRSCGGVGKPVRFS